MHRITPIDKLGALEIVTLEQNASNKVLSLDLWEKFNKKFYQIFVQINGLKISEIANNTIYFNVADRPEILENFNLLEDKLSKVLSKYLQKLNTKGKFTLSSILGGTAKSLNLEFKLVNSDYALSIFDKNKNIVNASLLNPESTYDIIFELLYINLAMSKGSITIDTRLRMMLENKADIPERVKLTSVDEFIEIVRQPTKQPDEDEKCYSIHDIDTESESENDADNKPNQTHEELNERFNQTLKRTLDDQELSDDSDDDAAKELFNKGMQINVPNMLMTLSDMFMRNNFNNENPTGSKNKVTECT